MKHVLWLIPILCLLGWGQMRGPDGFREECLLRGVSWPNPPQHLSQEEIADLLNQRFALLGHGTQSIALLGEDGVTVLKFLQNRSLKGRKRWEIPSVRDLLMGSRSERREEKRRREGREVLRRYALVYQKFHSETGLLCTQLEGNAASEIRVVCGDGQERRISLKGVPFWLQRRMEPAGRRLTQGKGGAELRAFCEQWIRKGFCDVHSRGIAHVENFGFIGDRVFLMDAGRIEWSEEQEAHPEESVRALDFLITEWLRGRR